MRELDDGAIWKLEDHVPLFVRFICPFPDSEFYGKTLCFGRNKQAVSFLLETARFLDRYLTTAMKKHFSWKPVKCSNAMKLRLDKELESRLTKKDIPGIHDTVCVLLETDTRWTIFLMNGTRQEYSFCDDPVEWNIEGFPDVMVKASRLYPTKNEALMGNVLRDVFALLKNHIIEDRSVLIDETGRDLLQDKAPFNPNWTVDEVAQLNNLPESERAFHQFTVSFSPFWMIPFTKDTVPRPKIQYEQDLKENSKELYRCTCCAMKHLKEMSNDIDNRNGNALKWPTMCSLDWLDGDSVIGQHNTIKFFVKIQFQTAKHIFSLHQKALTMALTYFSNNCHVQMKLVESYMRGLWNLETRSDEIESIERCYGSLLKLDDGLETNCDLAAMIEIFRRASDTAERHGITFLNHIKRVRLMAGFYSNVSYYLFGLAESYYTETLTMMIGALSALLESPLYSSILYHNGYVDKSITRRKLNDLEMHFSSKTFSFTQIFCKVMEKSDLLKRIRDMQAQYPNMPKEMLDKSVRRLPEIIYTFVESCIVSVTVKLGPYLPREKEAQYQQDFHNKRSSLVEPIFYLDPGQQEFISAYTSVPGVYLYGEADSKVFLVMAEGVLYSVLLTVDLPNFSPSNEHHILSELQYGDYYAGQGNYNFCNYYLNKENLLLSTKSNSSDSEEEKQKEQKVEKVTQDAIDK